ncbi:flippase [Vibrio coralliilyticus]|uniref:flippase n=1 Tax=Vibrio coralliilyticus TaxID=190893 RepID=UPI001E60BC4E|nr:flippase [Vibrio coralliilyticus]MCC2524569.1 flippase [Vibrio coralliilyticus]
MLDKVLFKNISALFSINVAGYIIPLVTLPYLVRVLGPEGYGTLAFSLAIIQYFIIIVRYGFDLSITRKIARCKNDKNRTSLIFWNVITTRLIIAATGFVILFVLVNFFESMAPLEEALFCSYIMVMGVALFPQWLFQGKEQLGRISTFRIVLQVINIPLIIIFVNDSSDIWVAALVNSAPHFLIVLVAIFIIYHRKWISWRRPSIEGIYKEVKDGWHLFISMAAINFYTTSTTVILGIIAGPTSVALYTSANKLLKAAQGLSSPISSSFFPRINSLMKTNKLEALNLIRYLMKIQLGVTAITCIGLFVFAPIVVNLLFGPGYERSVGILRILSILPIIIGVADVLANHVLLSYGYKKEFSNVYIKCGLISIVILVPLTYCFDAEGAAISVVIIEALVTLLMYFMVKKKQIPLFKTKVKVENV